MGGRRSIVWGNNLKDKKTKIKYTSSLDGCQQIISHTSINSEIASATG
jgi:hypothetical protein